MNIIVKILFTILERSSSNTLCHLLWNSIVYVTTIDIEINIYKYGLKVVLLYEVINLAVTYIRNVFKNQVNYDEFQSKKRISRGFPCLENIFL